MNTTSSQNSLDKSSALTIRLFTEEDIPTLVDAFLKADWVKPEITFEFYLMEQENNQRLMWVAFWENQLAGYVTLKWCSDYSPFQELNIPELKDLNVLPSFRGHGIANALVDVVEKESIKEHPVIGLSVGLYKDYGAAQRLYIRKGYTFDGQGITYGSKPVPPGEMVRVDDSLALWMTKKLRP